MPYILNLVLGCWILDNDSIAPGEFIRPNVEGDIQSLEGLVKHWNSTHNRNEWEDIHYPCIKEHFEVYETLPTNWRTFYDKVEVSQNSRS